MNLTPLTYPLATLTILVFTGCGSFEIPDLGLQATSQKPGHISASKPGSARFVQSHETRYIAEDALKVERRKKLRTTGLWVSKDEAEALGVDTESVAEGAPDAGSGQVVKKKEGGIERFFLPPKPLKRHMKVNTPRSGSRFVSGSNRFDPDEE